MRNVLASSSGRRFFFFFLRILHRPIILPLQLILHLVQPRLGHRQLILRILAIEQLQPIPEPPDLRIPRLPPHGLALPQRRLAAQLLDALRHPRLHMPHVGRRAQVRDIRRRRDRLEGLMQRVPELGPHLLIDLLVQRGAVLAGDALGYGGDEGGQLGHGFLEGARGDAGGVGVLARAGLVRQLEIGIGQRVGEEGRARLAVAALARVDRGEGLERCAQRLFVQQRPHPGLHVARLQLVDLHQLVHGPVAAQDVLHRPLQLAHRDDLRLVDVRGDQLHHPSADELGLVAVFVGVLDCLGFGILQRALLGPLHYPRSGDEGAAARRFRRSPASLVSFFGRSRAADVRDGPCRRADF